MTIIQTMVFQHALRSKTRRVANFHANDLKTYGVQEYLKQRDAYSFSENYFRNHGEA